MYSSRHDHALRRSREGSGRFVGGPVDNLATTSEASSIEPSSSSPQTSYYQSESSNSVVTTSTSTNDYSPFNHQVETEGAHQPTSETNTNNNNHTPPNEELNVLKSTSGNEASVASSEQRGTVITNMAVS